MERHVTTRLVRRVRRLLTARPTEIGVAAPTRRFLLVLHYILVFSLVGHAAFIVLFAWLGVVPLAVYNVASCMVFIVGLRLNRAHRYTVAFFIATGEVVLHSVLCAFFVGWGAGFHYFIVGIVPFVALIPAWKTASRFFFAGGILAVYGIAYFTAAATVPVFALSDAVTTALNYANLVVTFGAFAVLVHYLARTSDVAEQRILHLSRTDALTGVLNRRGMIEQLEQAYAGFRRHGRPFSVLLGDLDDFKQINDRHGHNCGDLVLIGAARTLVASVRADDVVSRWGGEEFLVLLPNTPAEGSERAANKILARIRKDRAECEDGAIHATMTLGCATYRTGDTIDHLIARADAALYYGKQTGKDTIVMSESFPGSM
ncbi:MAG: GGDEF domain-containing protein [Spirochaetaceae bacterium]|nr:MAG: GGDEF domain-containing protein [Spirochaetaceae bacterium]